MDIAAVVTSIVEIGITPTMLLIFIIIYFKRDGRNDERYDDLKKQFKERVDTLLAEGVRREEIMRSEAAQREKITREATTRREDLFIRSLDNVNATLEKTSICLDEMQKGIFQIDLRLQNIEKKGG